MKKSLKIWLVVSIVLIVILIGLLVSDITSIESEQTFVAPTPDIEEALPSVYKDLLVVETPIVEASIDSPLEISGQARGNWFFEATFPIVLTNWDGLIIAEGYAEAQEPWMTEEYVPFKATLVFTKPEYGERGTLILHKANASGLPEHDDAYEFTVFFK